MLPPAAPGMRRSLRRAVRPANPISYQSHPQSGAVQTGQAGVVDPGGQHGAGTADARHVNVMRADWRIVSQPGGSAAQQGSPAPGVPAQCVGQADGNLGKPLPQVTLIRRSALPRCLKNFVCVERPAVVDQLLRTGESC